VSPDRTVAGARISNRADVTGGRSTVLARAALSADGAGVVVCPGAGVGLREDGAGESPSDALWEVKRG